MKYTFSRTLFMEISWHQNPLRTTVRLTEQEKELLRLQVVSAEFEENVGMAVFHLDAAGQDKQYFDPEEALRQLRYVEAADVGDREYDLYLSELESGDHMGDCTCYPASCMKCHAEHIFGINTIEGLGKHSALKIYASFSRDEATTIHDVIERLTGYEPVRSGAWLHMPEEAFDQNVPRWKAEGERAVTWLVAYRDRHFPLL
jgi:hypothetical protein